MAKKFTQLVVGIAALQLGFLPAAKADFLPITDEFVLAQLLHVDLSWDTLVVASFQNSDVQSAFGLMQYVGTFVINPDDTEGFTGQYTGNLIGNFLDSDWSIDYSASMIQTITQDFTLTSKGTWPNKFGVPGDLQGKDFTDSGTITEDKNGKATVSGNVHTPGANPPGKDPAKDPGHVDIPFSAPVTKKTSGSTTTATGTATVNGHDEDTTFTLEQGNKSTSHLVSGIPGHRIIIDDSGTYNINARTDGGFDGLISFTVATEVTTVDEPASILNLIIGLAAFTVGLGSPRRRRSMTVGEPEITVH